MDKNSNFFPAGVALGAAFIKRHQERLELKEKILSNQQVVLMGPRHYGKTSLVEKVLEDIATPYCFMDLLAADSIEYVQQQMLGKVGKLVFNLLHKTKKATEVILSIFKSMKPEISLGLMGQQLKLELSSTATQDITELLMKLDEVAVHANKRAVIFIDEFQQISQLENYHTLEAAIRHAVERSKNISYVFSGSNRQLLIQMFGEQGRPLYRLCHLMSIDRMEESVYKEHLEILAKEKWKKTLSQESFSSIIKLTERHPFYFNMLCQLIWSQFDYPDEEMIESLWENYVRTQRHIISHDIMQLSINQRRVVSALAANPICEPFSSNFVIPLKLSTSSVQQAIEVLLKKDVIFVDEEGYYRVLEPAVSYYLTKIVWG